MLTVCITASYNVLDNSYGGGIRVLGLLNGLSSIPEIANIVVVHPYVTEPNCRKVMVETYFSHRKLRSLKCLDQISIVDEINPFRISFLSRIIKKFDVDVLQNESIWGGIFSANVAKHFSIPFIVDGHNIEAIYTKEMNRNQFIQCYAKWLESKVFNLSDHVLMVSEKERKEVSLLYGVPESKLSVIPNSVDTARFHPISPSERLKAKSALGLSGKFVLVFHGSLDYSPNLEAVLEMKDTILPKLVKAIPNAYLLVVGRNPPATSYNHDFMGFAGYVPNLREYLAAGDVAVIPLLRGGGTRLKVLDCLAMGLPIVATVKAVEGIDIVNGTHALLCKGVDQDFLENVCRVYGDNKLRAQLSINSRKLAEQYDEQLNALKLCAIYKRLAG